jgi:hypothetical protein
MTPTLDAKLHDRTYHAYPVITQRLRAPGRQLACRTRRSVSIPAGRFGVTHRVGARREVEPRARPVARCAPCANL